MEFLCPAIIVIVVIACIFTAIHSGNNRAAAKTAYQRSLALLRDDPDNAALRQRTLELGRAYSELTRKNDGVITFDEVALRNDIDAACAGAGTTAEPEQHADGQSAHERLANLDQLRQSGMITDAEYSEQRKRILDSI
jgi:hypothetical protein